MVRHDDDPLAGRREMFQAVQFDAVGEPQHDACQHAQHVLWQQLADPQRDAGIHNAEREVKIGRAEPDGDQQRGDDRRASHEQCAHDVTRGDDACPRRFVATPLDNCVQRHHENATANRDREQVDKNAQPRRVREKRGDAEQLA